MKTYRIIIILLASLLAGSCQRHYQIEERAICQLPISLSDELTTFEPGTSGIAANDVKTVYVNDTICILQLKAAYVKPDGTRQADELQYVYLVDVFMSKLEGHPIFLEEFRKVPLMTDKEIKVNKRHVKDSGEDVYTTFIGHGMPIRRSFDEK